MKKQSIVSKFHEHSGEEREKHGYKKPKNAKKAFMKFEKKEKMKSKCKSCGR